MSFRPIRIAILEADTPLTNTCHRLGSYGGVFTSFLHKAAFVSKVPLDKFEITGWDVVNEQDGAVEEMGGQYQWKRTRGYPRMDDIDAILITGSPGYSVLLADASTIPGFDAFADEPWIQRLVEFTEGALSSDHVRVIGVCFGHQIVGRALGAKVARSEGSVWEASVCQYTQTPKGKELFGGKEVLSIFQMHKDIVYYYPKGVEELGSSDKCQVQGMYVPKKLITVQGHPEFTEEIVDELIRVRHDQKIFDDNLYRDALARVGNEHDGIVVAQGFLKFLFDD